MEAGGCSALTEAGNAVEYPPPIWKIRPVCSEMVDKETWVGQ